MLFTVLKKMVIGAFFLYGANVLIQQTGLHIVMNPFTAFLAGFLGLPGVLSLAAIHFFIFR
ncbi:pro-sigmaK processing inhibitor BofA family protein [Domibacillus sp. A3M-37]|uniref:pro-sigmaK processing inhibitor BofA family protein n=1 Tax=Domibacillus sp. A3M-37 TaxID=2962037 RepID=UPI002112E490|nr:pro-sigmaK processing inhibitor BofA family protein [Domibacillus sp. A3M-37]